MAKDSSCSFHHSIAILFLCFDFRVNEVLFGVCSNDVLFSLTSDEVSQNIEGNRLARLAGHLLQQQSFSPQFPVPQNLLAQVRCCVLFILPRHVLMHWRVATAVWQTFPKCNHFILSFVSSFISQYDLRHSKHWEFQAHPDVLILPSRLNPIAKDVFGSLVVNPGALTRGAGGGTFAQLAIHPIKEADLRAAIVQQSTAHQQQNQHNNNGDETKLTLAEAFPHQVAARTSVTISKI